jgi:hypothetical protein
MESIMKKWFDELDKEVLRRGYNFRECSREKVHIFWIV